MYPAPITICWECNTEPVLFLPLLIVLMKCNLVGYLVFVENNSEGVLPFFSGVVLYFRRISRIFSRMDNNSLDIAANLFLRVCMFLSASPFVVRCQGAMNVWNIPQSWQNNENVSLLKIVALSDTITSGYPLLVKMFSRISIVDSRRWFSIYYH